MDQLKATLGPISGTLMMLNIVLGASLFILPGLAAQQTGPASIVYWLLAILLSLPLLVIFCLLAAERPSSGGVAHLVGAAFGRRFFVMASYLFLGAVMLGLPAIALSAGYALQAGFGLNAGLSAGFIITLAVAANFLTPKRASQLGSTASILSISFLVALIVFGFIVTPSSGLLSVEEVFSSRSFTSEFSIGLSVIPLIFFAFTGWEVAISLGGEFKKPKRNVPIAIGASFIIASILYLLCAMVVVHAGVSAFNEAPFVGMLAPVFGVFSSQLIAGFIAGLLAVNLFAAIWSVSRMIFSISEQGFLPASLKVLSRGLPARALLLFGSIGLIMIGVHEARFIDIDTMFTLASLNFLCLYGLVAFVGLLQLKRHFQRLLAAIAIASVAAILLMTQSLPALSYPLFIACIGWFAFFRTQRQK
ncbi:MAG: L-methionine/branched-chain amino acid exporter YjeH [Rhodospirillaceae bacterium]|nr:MAG: L-methionine/branched-chain amino acid exporter YjeH [Rhodospirillaceae bacterium]